ncbi:Fur family transcriptional regulator [Rhodovibrio salinarum]|uniref:Transcriptional repressor n=1 Tax=Rhodovibrio salinarum TaxID=1087 RepID=A0A934QH54_9PROT|nr:Fur family transcriptional regulator [Rhodovibrio salinarum]MBK1696587.1 transcriptional repressor [Rhodovibrio salinarum]
MESSQTRAAFDQHEHDHRDCIDAALTVAQEICARDGAQLTKTRRRVLELIWAHRKPVGAYQLLDDLSRERGRVAPPTVYRAIDFLLDHGLIHRIESLNAFIGCHHPRETHTGCFLICRACGATAELEDPKLDRALNDAAANLAFQVERRTVEMRGLCPVCAQTAEGSQFAH